MNILDKTRLLQTSILSSLIMGLGGVAYAQTNDVEEVPTAAEEEFSSDGDIVVTGSRIKRDTFTSTSPLQVLDGETISEAGFLDLGEALRTTSVVQGIQLDSQTNSVSVTEAGPGGQSIGLRGLGPERTLVLINGRRFAPAGIEGAPSFPDISLIPTSIIERNDILLDGASSVYGSDAIAGVVNVILKDDFEGLEIGGQLNHPFEDGGESISIDAIGGISSDKGSFVMAAEYNKQYELRGNSRDWMCGVQAGPNFPDLNGQSYCHTFRYETDGRRDLDRGANATIFQQFALTAPFNILLPRPGTANPAVVNGQPVPNFIRADLGGNFNGLYTPSAALNQDVQILPEFERFTLFTNAKVGLDDFIEGSEWFAEFSLSNRKSDFRSPLTTLQFTVTPDNPYIPVENFAASPAPFLINPLNPIRGGVESELSQYRFFSGVRGDLDFLGSSFLNDWDYEVFAGYTRSQGYSARPVVLENNLLRAVNTEVDPNTGAIVCSPAENPTDFFFGADENLEPCVPFNPFFSGLYGTPNPQFQDDPNTVDDEGQRLLDYLQGTRSSTTFVDQKIAGAYITGGLFDLPAGEVKAVFGAEWREDSIDTRSDDVTSRGLGQGFFRDLPSVGDVSLFEVYGETVIPILSGKPLVDTLEVELAGRYIDHEFYGSNETYSGKVRYQPVDWLTFRGTYGTSFRAPNLRDLFLKGQSSFQDITDPCEVPNLAQTDTSGDGVLDTYTPGADDDNDGIGDLDGRSQLVLDNCQAINIDPFSLGLGINFGDIEVFDAGNQGLDPETSTAWSLGFTLDQPWVDDFDLQLGASYWQIEIKDAIFDPSANFLVGSCYTATDFPDNAFCTRQGRGTAGQLIEVDATPFNIGSEIAEGIDFNLRFDKEFGMMGKDFDFGIQSQATKTLNDNETITIGGSTTFRERAGTIESPDWRANSQQRLSWDDFSLFWNVRFIGEGEQNRDADRPDRCEADGSDSGEVIDNCFNTDNVMYHDISFSYSADKWAFRAGLQNAFDKNPPQVSGDIGGIAIDDRNVPLGVGYDRRGRTAFVSMSRKF